MIWFNTWSGLLMYTLIWIVSPLQHSTNLKFQNQTSKWDFRNNKAKNEVYVWGIMRKNRREIINHVVIMCCFMWKVFVLVQVFISSCKKMFQGNNNCKEVSMRLAANLGSWGELLVLACFITELSSWSKHRIISRDEGWFAGLAGCI